MDQANTATKGKIADMVLRRYRLGKSEMCAWIGADLMVRLGAGALLMSATLSG